MIGKSRSNDHRIRLLLTTLQPGSSPDVLYQKQHDFRSDKNRWGRAFAHGRARLRPGRGQLAAFGGRNRAVGLSQDGLGWLSAQRQMPGAPPFQGSVVGVGYRLTYKAQI